MSPPRSISPRNFAATALRRARTISIRGRFAALTERRRPWASPTQPAGGRAGKRDGGVVLDVPGGEVLASGLSMPHSPRWHDGRLWVLESGTGGVGFVDLAAGRYQEVARLPGFTRGFDFAGPWAFVGLSQVRESAVFSGIAVAERAAAAERCCGVWVLDLRTGQTAAFLRFEDAVQEVFAVQVLHGVRWPDVMTDDDGEDDDGRRLIADSFVLPDDACGAARQPLR